MQTIQLQHVDFMPRELKPDILYVAEEFDIAGHLCACGCGNKVMTPLGPVDWKITVKDGKPTMRPSIGNWELPCQSHYWIEDGVIRWSDQWSKEEIITGRQREEQTRQEFYRKLEKQPNKRSWFKILVDWFLRRK